MSARRFAFVLALSFGLSAVSSAGPIAFTYTATGYVTPPPGAVPFYSPGDVTFALAPPGAASGSNPVELGTVTFGPTPGPLAPDTYTAYMPFVVSVVVSDSAGRVAALDLAGGATDDWVYRSWDGRWLNDSHRLELGDSYHENASDTSTILGDTRYTLAVRPENDAQAGVYTLTATALTPEPGTFALAALGLVPLALRRFRRK